jgi:ribosome maturation factor RimP
VAVLGKVADVLATFFVFHRIGGSASMSVTEDIETRVAPLLAEAGVELVDVEYRREPTGWVLRFYLDKPGGFTLTDCEIWNDRLGQAVEESGLIPHAYSLEVSSPGLNRPLKRIEDFRRFLGVDAVVKLYAPQNGQKNFHGKMVAVDGEELLLEDRTSGLVRLPVTSIASAKLDPPVEI